MLRARSHFSQEFAICQRDRSTGVKFALSSNNDFLIVFVDGENLGLGPADFPGASRDVP